MKPVVFSRCLVIGPEVRSSIGPPICVAERRLAWGQRGGSQLQLNPRAGQGYRERQFARGRSIDRKVDMNVTRRLRGVIGMATTWACAFPLCPYSILLSRC